PAPRCTTGTGERPASALLLTATGLLPILFVAVYIYRRPRRRRAAPARRPEHASGCRRVHLAVRGAWAPRTPDPRIPEPIRVPTPADRRPARIHRPPDPEDPLPRPHARVG